MSIDFSKFVQKVVSPLGFLPSHSDFLRQLRFSGGKYSEFAEILAKGPEFETNLLSAANQLFESRLKEPLTTPEVALSMIGYIPSRNFLTASIILSQGSAGAQGSTAELLPNSPAIAGLLSFSLESEKLGTGFPGDYFMGGSVFDIISARLFPVTTPPSEERPAALNEIWQNGILTAKVACQISKALVPTWTLERELCLDGLLHDIGKVAYTILGIGGGGKAPDAKSLPIQGWMEESREYKYPHDILGHLILWRLGFLHDTSWVVLYHHQPFLAEKLGKAVHARTLVIWLADHAIRYQEYHKGPKYSDRILANWHSVFQKLFKDVKKEQFFSTIKGLKVN